MIVTDSINLPRGTIEYVTATVTADVDLTMGVEVSLHDGQAHAWQPGQWVGDVGKTRQVRTVSAVDTGLLAGSSYSVFVRLSDATETPIIRAGRFVITG